MNTLKRICASSWAITKNHCMMHGQQNVKFSISYSQKLLVGEAIKIHISSNLVGLWARTLASLLWVTFHICGIVQWKTAFVLPTSSSVN